MPSLDEFPTPCPCQRSGPPCDTRPIHYIPFVSGRLEKFIKIIPWSLDSADGIRFLCGVWPFELDVTHFQRQVPSYMAMIHDLWAEQNSDHRPSVIFSKEWSQPVGWGRPKWGSHWLKRAPIGRQGFLLRQPTSFRHYMTLWYHVIAFTLIAIKLLVRAHWWNLFEKDHFDLVMHNWRIAVLRTSPDMICGTFERWPDVTCQGTISFPGLKDISFALSPEFWFMGRRILHRTKSIWYRLFARWRAENDMRSIPKCTSLFSSFEKVLIHIYEIFASDPDLFLFLKIHLYLSVTGNFKSDLTWCLPFNPH